MQEYSAKFILRVVDLTHTEPATEEDRAWGLDYWARLFKATTWEELKMIAKNNQVFTEVSEALYELNADEIMRQRCRAREDFILHQNALNRKLQELTAEKQELASEIERLKAKLAKYEASNAAK